MAATDHPARPLDRVVVVGASLAGLRAAETLRQREFAGDVVVVGAESERPYDRPPLSKKLLAGDWEADRVALRPPDVLDELDVEWRLGEAATGLGLSSGVGEPHRIELGDGTALDADGLVIATGARPRVIPSIAGDHRVHVLRTLADSLRLRAALAGGDRRVVVIGAGFIGLEVAATARGGGHDVLVVEAAPAPLIRGLGAAMGEAIADLHRAQGVEIRCGVGIEELDPVGVRLTDGNVIDADVVVVGIGVEPATDWLGGSGIARRDGVVCDASLAALDERGERVPGVVAAGDVVRWPNERFGEEMRVEHWTNAAEQGAHAAATLLARALGDEPEPYAPIPFFWSDQYRHRIQFLGTRGPDDDVAVAAGDVDDGKWLALYGRDGRLRGALGVNAPKWLMPTRRLFDAAASWEQALEYAAGLQ